MKKAIVIVLGALLIFADMAACGGQQGSTGESRVLVIADKNTMNSLDIFESSNPILKEQTRVTECLVYADENFEMQPWLAASWEWDGALAWTFRLRQDVTFHDGTKLDAEAVKWCFDRLLETNASFSSLTSIAEINVEGDYTVIFTTSQPNADLPAVFCGYDGVVVAPSCLDADGKFVALVGTGPFKVKEINTVEGILEVEKYEGYYGDGFEGIDGMIYRHIADPNTRILALEKGEVDLISEIPFSEMEALQSASGIKVERFRAPRNYVISFNMKKEMLQDVRVREALVCAYDEEAVVNDVLYGVGGVAKGPYMEEMAWANRELQGHPYNPEKAKTLLKETGWEDTDGDGVLDKDGNPLNLTMILNTFRAGNVPIVEAMQGYYRQIGVNLAVEPMESAAQLEAQEQGKFDMSLTCTAVASIPTPAYFLEYTYHSKNNANFGFANKELDALIDACKASDDLTEKYELSRQAQAACEEELAAFIAAHYGISFGMSDAVGGFAYNPAANNYYINKEITLNR